MLSIFHRRQLLALGTSLAALVPLAAAADAGTLTGAAPLVIAHRGASGYLPEHTLGGYELAVRMGADYIEPDLQLTRDGQLVAMHDASLLRTTNVASLFDRRGTGDGYAVSQFTLAEIKTLTVKPTGTGAASYPGFTPSSADAYRVPTFQEVITLARAQSALSGREIGIYPEAKQADPVMEDKILETLVANGYGSNDKVFIQSFSAETIQSIHTKQTALGLDYDLVVLSGSPTALINYGLDKLATFADGLGVSITGAGMSESFIAAAHANHLLVHGYTFSKTGNAAKTEYLKFYGWGMDGVFSNYTDLAVEARTEFLAAVPEPQTWALFAFGVAGLAVARRRAAGSAV